MTQKNILIIGTYPPPFGGVSSHIKYLSDFLVARGDSVYVISSGKPSKGDKENAGVTVLRVNKEEKITALIGKSANAVKFFSKAKKLGLGFIEATRVAATCVIAESLIKQHGITLISVYCLFDDGLIGAMLSELCNVPLVVTAFGEIYNHPDVYKQKVGLVKYILSKASRVVSSSNYCAKTYETLGIQQTVDVVYYGIDIDHFSSGGDKVKMAKDTLGVKDDESIVLFVGRMSRQMGLDVLLGAIPLVLEKKPEAKFIIVGGKEELYEQAIEVAKTHPKNVFVFPNAPFEDLAAYYALTTISVVPTAAKRPSMGMAIKEAFAAGKPVIASESGGIPEAVIHDVNGMLVPPHDPAILAKAILELVEDPQKIARMGQAAKERAKSLFDKEMTNQKMYAIFEASMQVK